MSDINKQMAEFAKELWENYIKPKVGIEFSDTVSYYMATVVSNDGYNRVTIKRPFDDAYQVSCLDDMAGLEAGDTVLVLRFGNGTNNANHIVFGKGNGNMNYTAAAATATATEASVAAGQAAEAAADAIESAGQAASAAESAQQSAQAAQQSANTANQAANNALIGLATVEGVVDTVNWFAEHKTASTDTSVVPSKTYYEYNPVAGTLSAVTPEGDENPSEEGWYELSEAISNYVAAHIATTNDGLYVVGLSNGWKVLVSSGTGTYTAGIFLIDPSGNIAQATTANGITFDDSKPFYIGDNNASIVFDGNGHISISGIGVSIGSTGSKSINEILTELGASIKTIEYGVGNSATSHSDITSWSSNTPEWQEDKYIWQRTTTNGLTYTYTCIQGAAGEPGAPGVSVSGVTNYYLATSQSSGVTRETTGWTTSIQTMTSTNQYLWNYEVVTGSDGSTLNTTDPIIIGRYGQDGSPGGQGRGITGITEYYLVSNQQTGITPSSSGWTTTVQTTSTTTPYLWNYEVITYTSGSPDTSDARIIGTHGPAGKDAYSYSLNVSNAAVAKTTGGTYNPTSITLSATRIQGEGTPAAYSGRFKIETYDGSTWTQRYPSSGSGTDQSSYTYTIPTNITITSIRCSLYLAGGALTDARLLDQQSVPIVTDGSSGSPGADAYTVILTNENHTFAGSTTAALAANAECAVVAYKGATQVAATIGTISGQPTGMTTSISGNGTTSAKFTVSVTTSMTSKNGVLTVPVTVDSKTFQMKFTYSLALAGEKGESGINSATIFLYQRAASTPSKPSSNLTYNFANRTITGTLGNWQTAVPTTGTAPLYVTIATAAANTETDTIVPADWSAPSILAQDGGTGVGISSVTELYYSKANTTAPSAPTSTVTTNDPSVQNAWNKALPTYSASYPHYFTCSEVIYTNGTRNWTTPVYAGALTTANQTAASANSTATTANSTANAAKDKIDNLEVGGRNLLIAYDALPPSKRSINAATGYTYDPDTGTYVVKQTAASSNFVQIYSIDAVTDAAQLAGKEVTFSARNITSSRDAASPRLFLYITKTGGSVEHYDINKSLLKKTITLPSNTEKIGYILRLDQNTAGSTGETATFVGVKCELGNTATDWTPAPEDTLAAIANIEVGGRNLLVGSSTGDGWSYSTFDSTDGCVFTRATTSTTESYISGRSMMFEPGQIYTVSAYIKKSGPVRSVEIYKVHQSGGGSHQNKQDFQVTDDYKKYTWTFTCNAATDETAYIRFDNNGSTTAGTNAILYVKNPKLEKGNKATDWTPAPEDFEEAIEAVEDTATEALNKHGFCSCSTAANVQAKTASLSGFQLKTGSTVHVTFTNSNTVASSTLNINGTGAKTIKYNGGSVEADKSPWAAGECVTFVYDGTYWVIAGQSNILADNIVAGSIAADRIKTNVISAVNGGTGTINADKVNIGIGGRNYLRNSNKYSAWYWPSAAASYLTATSDYIKFTPTNSYAWWGIEPMPNNIPIGEWDTTAQYTLSIDFKIEGKTGSPDYPIVSVMTKSSTAGGHGYRVREKGLANLASVGTSNWARYTYTFSGDYTTWTSQGSGTAVCVSVWIWLHSTSSEYTAAYFRNIKLEKGNVATDWSPAPADEGAIATDYITNISNGGITVTGNSASSKIEIASTVKVIRDSTHFSEMTASDFNVYSGNATYPVAKLGQVGASLSGDGAGVYLARILKTTFVDTPTAYGGTFELYNTSGGTGVRISAGPSYGTQLFYNSSNKTLLRIGSNESGQGEVSVFKATSSTSTIAAKIGTLTVTSGGNTLVNNEPTLAFYDNGTMRSWYSLKRAFISDGTRAGYVVYGNTANHGFNIDYLTTGRINFYVDGTSIGYATITSSDERMKTDIKQIDERYKDAVSNVELKNFHFDFNDPTRAGANLLERFGAVAQDVIAALEDEGLDWEDSEIVETLKDDDGEYYVINYVPFLVARLAADEDRIKELEDKNAELEARLAAIEAKLGL